MSDDVRKPDLGRACIDRDARGRSTRVHVITSASRTARAPSLIRTGKREISRRRSLPGRQGEAHNDESVLVARQLALECHGVPVLIAQHRRLIPALEQVNLRLAEGTDRLGLHVRIEPKRGRLRLTERWLARRNTQSQLVCNVVVSKSDAKALTFVLRGGGTR